MKTFLGVVGFGGLALMLGAAPAMAQLVNCDDPASAPFGSIQDALNSGNTFVDFTGNCVESLFIPQDRTTIRGADPAATIFGGVFTTGVTGLRFLDLTIDASGDGLFFTNGTYVEFDNVTVVQSAFGVGLLRNSGARIRDSHLGPSTSDDPVNACPALCLLENSDVRLIGTTVEDDSNNPDVGGAIGAFRDSSVTLRGGNVITNTGAAPAIEIDFDSSLRQDVLGNPAPDVIEGGIVAFGKTYLDIRQATVSGGIEADLDSTVRLGGSIGGAPSQLVVDGGITLDRDSSLAVESPEITINGDVRCLDPASWTAGTFVGTGIVKGCRMLR